MQRTLIDISVTISPIYDANRQVIAASKIARDITNIVEHECKLSQFKSIVEFSDDAIISKDLNGTILSWNQSATKIFGYSAEEMIGEKMLKIFPKHLEHEEDEILRRIQNGEKLDHFRSQRLHKNGNLLDISVSISPIYDDIGNIIGASKIARDITEQVANEQRIAQFKTLVDSSEDAIISNSLDGTILTWNLAAKKIFGYSDKEIVGKSISTLFPAERIHEEDKLLQNVIAGKPIRHFRTTRLNKNQQKVYVSISISAIHNKHGEITGFSNIIRDMTEEVQQERTLERSALRCPDRTAELNWHSKCGR